MLENPPRFTAGQVARYYDQNTGRFLQLGGSGATAAIHRQIWAPGVEEMYPAGFATKVSVAGLPGSRRPAPARYGRRIFAPSAAVLRPAIVQTSKGWRGSRSRPYRVQPALTPIVIAAVILPAVALDPVTV